MSKKPANARKVSNASSSEPTSPGGASTSEQQTSRKQRPSQPAPQQPAPVPVYQQPPVVYQQPPMPMMAMPSPMDPSTGRVFVDPNDPNTLHYEGFDAGARFSDIAPPRIPPPPPGVMPNPAQVAHMQGQNVVVTQKKANVFSGGTSGGVDSSCVLM
ncbi:uncharacterized protein LOC144132928 [Amblyomma americanum]